jgi:hypothetical protein
MERKPIMSASPSSLAPKRPRGAPLGNRNALKHGFYAIKPEVLSRFTNDMKGDISDEIDALRNQADITINVFAGIEHPTLAECLATLRGISQAFETMRGLYMSQKLLYYNHTPIEQALDELAKIPFEED